MRTAVISAILLGAGSVCTAQSWGWHTPDYRDNQLCQINRGAWGWRGFPDKKIEVPVQISDKASECEVLTISWDNEAIPARRGLNYHVFASALYVGGNGVYGRDAPFQAQEFLTPETTINWTVNYPEGTVIQVEVEAYDDDLRIFGKSTSFVVHQGSNNACVPDDHYPVLAVFPDSLTACETATFTLIGGRQPFQAFARGNPGYEDLEVQRNGLNNTVTFLVDFPEGNVVTIGFQTPRASTSRFATFAVQPGTTNSCIPKSHYPKRNLATHPAAIAGYVVLGLIALGGALFGLIKLVKFVKAKRAKHAGAIQLPA